MKIRILSANMWLLPYPFSVEHKKRAGSLIELINQFDPEIVLLQEIWMKKWIKYIFQSIKNDYQLVHNSRSAITNRTGLVGFSKYEVISSNTNKYINKKPCSLLEKLASKGYIEFIINKKGELIKIINTHLYDPVKISDKKILKDQLKQIDSIVRKSDMPGILTVK